MVRDFHLGKDSDIGYYVSLITTAFAISQVLSGKDTHDIVDDDDDDDPVTDMHVYV